MSITGEQQKEKLFFGVPHLDLDTKNHLCPPLVQHATLLGLYAGTL